VSEEQFFRDRVLRGLALNRTPGYHYIGNYLDFSFDHVAERDLRMAMEVGPHCCVENGDIAYSAMAVFVDIAMAANVRAGHTPASRLATVQMNLQFTGEPMTGRLDLRSSLQSYVKGITSTQGAAAATVTAHGKPVCLGYGTFMVLDPPKGVSLYNMSHRKWSDPDVPMLKLEELDRDERKVVAAGARAIAAMQNGKRFYDGFIGIETKPGDGGATAKLPNGPHVGNRVGHLQGGVTMALGIASAEASLPAGWRLSAVTAWYISPGQGRVIRARSRVVHHGRLTAVVRTEILGKNNRRVMEMVTTHASRAA
jgi:acyl-coenzyme A thioesterase PaaI-like protein